MRLQLKLKSITLRPAKCWSKYGTPKLKEWGCCNVLSGQGHRAPWSNGGLVISRGNPKERGEKPVHVAFRKHVIRDWITLQLFLVFCGSVFYWTMLPIVHIIQHRIIIDQWMIIWEGRRWKPSWPNASYRAIIWSDNYQLALPVGSFTVST
jgi:hypothetical protein